MKKIFLLMTTILFVLSACQKEPNTRKVTLQINGLTLPYKVIYFDKDGNTVKTNITPTTTNKVWKQEFVASEGDLVYLYVEYKEKVINNMAFAAGIYIDGKAYLQAKNYDMSVGDSIFKIKRSGVVPITN